MRTRKPNRRRGPSIVSMTAAFTRAREGGWCATILGGVGAHTQGETLAEARRNLAEVVQDLLEVAPHQLPSSPSRRRVARGTVCETFTFRAVS